jgi:hypothetical protein
MDDVGRSGAFGLEQGEHKERMLCQFKGACLSFIVQPSDTHLAIIEEVLILERKTEATMIVLSYFVLPIQLCETGAWDQLDALGYLDDRIGEWRDQGQFGWGIGFGMIRFGQPKHVASVFDQGMLATAARS